MYPIVLPSNGSPVRPSRSCTLQSLAISNILPQFSVIQMLFRYSIYFRKQNIFIFLGMHPIPCLHNRLPVPGYPEYLSRFAPSKIGEVDTLNPSAATARLRWIFRHLSDVHTGRPRGFQHDVQRTSFSRNGISSTGSTRGTTPLFPVTTSHLIADRDFSSVRCRCGLPGLLKEKFVAVFTGKYFSVHDDTILTVRGTFRGKYHVLLLLSRQRWHGDDLSVARFLPRSYFSDQNITGTYLCTDADDSTLVQVF